MARRREEEEEDEDEVYHVEVITKARVSEEGDWEYLVKWAGYDSDADSWEPADNVKQCDRLLGSFWRHIGLDDEDYPVGHIVSAREDWINKEKKYFAETFFKPSSKQRSNKETDKRKREKRKLPAISSESDDDHSDSSDDIPLPRISHTKRRAVNTSVNPLRPAPAPRTKKPNILQGSSKLNSLSFKKNKLPSSVVVQAKDYTKLSTTSTAPPPPPRPPQPPLSVRSPAEPDLVDDLFGSSPEDLPTSFGPPQVSLPPKRPVELMAEQFLETVNIPALKDPIEPESTSVCDHPRVKPTVKPPPMRIPKKWKWCGDLFINGPSGAELLCNVTIQSPLSSENSSTISVLMSKLTALRLLKLYHLYADLPPLFRAFGKPQYFAQLNATEVQDKVYIQGLRHHMATQQQAALVPLSLDQTEVAALVICPAIWPGLMKFLQVPDHPWDSGSLLVVLIPLSITSSVPLKIGQRPVKDVQGLHPQPKGLHGLCKKPIIHQAFVCLGFPTPLLEFLDNPNRTCGIWFSSSDCGHSASGVETALLQLIIGATRATLTSLQDDVRVVFIHVGSLLTIQALPSLVKKLSETPETQFFTYGTHPSVDSQRWGIHEIFPVGGIISFTAAALAEDPVGCYQLMTQADEHPLWDSFVTPNVLAASNSLAMGGDMSSPSCLEPILDLVDAGQVTLLKFPVHDPGNMYAWMSLIIHECAVPESELLEACTASLTAQMGTSSSTRDQLLSAVNHDLEGHTARLRLQPCAMDQYRRFVIIRAESEGEIPGDRNGFEWLTVVQFGFKDSFFEA